MQHLVDLVAVGAIDVLEDVVAELLDLADDIPRFVVIDGLVDVVENPSQLLTVVVQAVDEVVDGLLFHLLVVEGDAQVRGKVELACQIAKHTLEKGVDGLDAEIAVVVDELAQGLGCLLGGMFLRDAQFFDDALHIVVGVGQPFPNAVELAEDACLHLLGGLVGEGHGEDALV